MKKFFSLIAAVLFAGSMMADNFVLVTDASTLAAGDQIIITNTAADKALGTTQNTNNRAAVAVAEADGVIVPGENVQVITLEASGDNWMLKVGDGQYLYSASSSNNYLKTSTAETAGNNGVFAITIDENVAAVEAQGTNRPSMRYNTSGMFSCYGTNSSIAAGLKIYKKSNEVVMAYYLAGTMTSWAPNEAYRFVKNPANESEYMLNITLAEGNQEMKVAYSDGSTIADENWFPSGMGNNFVIESAGDYTIYFRPAGDGDQAQGWHQGYIFAEYHEPLVVTNCATAAQAGLSVSANNEIYKEGDKEIFTIRGYVTGIKTAYSDTYHNISFWMADDADGGEVIQAYRADCASAEAAPAVGDKVEITGKITKYGTTPQFAAGCTFTILDPTAIDNTAADAKAVKFFENGQLIILKNGVRYNAQGAIVK